MADYYKILEIEETADIKDIKKAYRELSMLWHPDRNKDPEAVSKIQLINEAYETLENEEKRKIYDDTRRMNKFQNMNTPSYSNASFNGDIPTRVYVSSSNVYQFHPAGMNNAHDIHSRINNHLIHSFMSGGLFGFNVSPGNFNGVQMQSSRNGVQTSFHFKF
jgi:curved DNA-binding protein CbpA